MTGRYIQRRYSLPSFRGVAGGTPASSSPVADGGGVSWTGSDDGSGTGVGGGDDIANSVQRFAVTYRGEPVMLVVGLESLCLYCK